MPVNFNALLRYKTIDACLRNIHKPSTIESIIEECSKALYESTGVKKVVSERTIRNDIRIMRSDILGFNAPIVVREGIYFYKNPDYSIFGKSVKEMELLKDIQQLLIDEFDNIDNEKLPYLIISLAKVTKVKIPRRIVPDDYWILEKRLEGYIKSDLEIYKENLEQYFHGDITFNMPVSVSNTPLLRWDFIYKAIM